MMEAESRTVVQPFGVSEFNRSTYSRLPNGRNDPKVTNPDFGRYLSVKETPNEIADACPQCPSIGILVSQPMDDRRIQLDPLAKTLKQRCR